MIMYVVTILVFIAIIANYVLGKVLYKEPNNEKYFSNVNHYNTINKKVLMASPKYVVILSISLGIFLGAYHFLCALSEIDMTVTWAMTIVLMVLYLIEITRKISITEENLELEKMFCTTKKIPLNSISGLYIYSFKKKFLNKRALTTKLVVTTNKEKYKFTLSSIDIKAVMNMMKENFGVTENKMYVLK